MNNKKIVLLFLSASFGLFWHFSLKLKTIHKMFLSVPIKGKAQLYASLHSNFHEYLGRHDADKVGHTCSEGNITQTTCTNIIRVVVLALSLHIIWHDLLVVF